MTSKLLAAGSAFVVGLAILANPRAVRMTTLLVLDGQFYLGPTDQDVLIGSLRYYNSFNLSFDDKPALYFVYTTVRTQIIICFWYTNKSLFSLLYEDPTPMCQFQATEHLGITPLLVTYSG